MLFTDILLTSMKKVGGVFVLFFFCFAPWQWIIGIRFHIWSKLFDVYYCIMYSMHKPIVKSDFWIFYIKKLKIFRLACMYFNLGLMEKSKAFTPVTCYMGYIMSCYSLKHINKPFTDSSEWSVWVNKRPMGHTIQYTFLS